MQAGRALPTYLQYERIEEVDVGERANQWLNDQLRNHLTPANSTAHEQVQAAQGQGQSRPCMQARGLVVLSGPIAP